ncbi:MAG: hypothetical protein IJ914_06710 [Prevotella sp.]|nr:hypothetical protein [Prevotella sp.]
MFDKGQGKRATERGKPCGKAAGHSIRGGGSYEGRGGALWRDEEGHYGGTRRGRWARNGREREAERILMRVYIIIMYARKRGLLGLAIVKHG